MIKRFVRTGKKQGKKVAVLIATVNEDNKIVVGHSKWNRKMDPYNPSFGEIVARRRMEAESSVPPATSIAKDYVAFVERAQRYFKDTELSESTAQAFVKAGLEVAAMEAKKIECVLEGC